jgi:hypothetical protein
LWRRDIRAISLRAVQLVVTRVRKVAMLPAAAPVKNIPIAARWKEKPVSAPGQYTMVMLVIET